MELKLRRVGGAERIDHTRLSADHKCYFWGEYTPWKHTKALKGEFSETNRLIEGFKIPVDRQDPVDLARKQLAIRIIAAAFAKFWRWRGLFDDGVLLVPMPPSQPRNNALYDDRMMRLVTEIRSIVGVELPIRDLLEFDGSTSIF